MTSREPSPAAGTTLVRMATSWATATNEQRRVWLQSGRVPRDYPEPVARDWEDLLGIVESRVRPERAKLGDNGDARRRREKWWLWGRYTPGFFRSIVGLQRVLAISRVGEHAAFAFLPAGMAFSEQLIVFPFSIHAAFCVLQSRLHETWARFFGSSLEERLRYTPPDCFETFSFPRDWEADTSLQAAGAAYYDFRSQLMLRGNEGLTTTYNRFHDRHEEGPETNELRRLHTVMDHAVLHAYGWTDVENKCDFLPDQDVDDMAPAEGRGVYRYRWPDEIKSEVLGRLLELNAERASPGQVRPRRFTSARGET